MFVWQHCTKCAHPVLQRAVEQLKHLKPRSVCVCAHTSSFFTCENTVLWSVCFQPFPQQVSSDTRRWCLIQPTQRARWKTASLPWETVWPESSAQTWRQPSTHSSQGQLAYFVHARNVVLCETHIYASFCQLCKSLFPQQHNS